MENFTFVCIGTNKIITDSLGPRIGEKLKKHFQNNSHIQVFGTLKSPIHYKNANKLLNNLKKQENEYRILVDSALGNPENIGKTYLSRGGIELGKAFGKSFYFPAQLNIKTNLGNKLQLLMWNYQNIELLSQRVASQITEIIEEMQY